MATYLEQSLEKLTEFEGAVPWMYLDTAGNVTVGVGTRLAEVGAAIALPFRAGGDIANPHQIEAEFNRVRVMERGLRAEAYRCGASPELDATAIAEQLRRVLASFERQLRQSLQEYDRLPDPAKIALLDMTYNLGLGGLLRGYPKLLAALATGRWEVAAAECLRHGISAERNAWTRLQFLNAAAEAGVAAVIRAVSERSRETFAWAGFAALTGVALWAAVALWKSVFRERSHLSFPKRDS